MTHALIQESMDKRQHVRDLLAQTPEDYAAVRDLWKSHSLAEDARDIAGLMATLTDDCVYELVQTGHRWEGHEGATQCRESQILTRSDDLHEALGLSQPNVSRQLAILRAAGIVEDRRDGKWVHYRLLRQTDPACERQLRALIKGFAKRELLRGDVARLLKVRGPGACP